jgi:hypothetical protein
MEMVLALASGVPNNLLARYPNRKPLMCRPAMDATSLRAGTVLTTLALAAAMEPQMRLTSSTQMKGVRGATAAESLGSLLINDYA